LLLSLTVTEKALLIKAEQKYLDMVPLNLRYNFCPTAGSSLGYKHTAEALAAISDTLKGNTYRVGSTHSAETKTAISKAQKGENNSFFGKSHSDATKAALSEALKGNTNRALCVYVYDSKDVLVGSFPSHTEAAAFLGCSRQRVDQLVKSGGRTRKGFRVISTPLA
jgi:group I intron endonuclease